MANTKKTHSLTISLVKESFSLEEEILINDLESKEIGSLGKLFYKKSCPPIPPRWMRLFEGYDLKDLFSSSASAVLLVEVQNRYFALTFGPAGRHLLQRGVTEERFGLKVTLNSVKENSIRSIDTKTLESEGIQTRFQSSKPVPTDTFGLDVEKDLVRSVTGESKDEKFGKTLTGKDSLRASIKCDLEDLKSFLQNFLDQYKRDDYKTKFKWIDALREINDPLRIKELNKRLIQEINKHNPEKLCLTVPEILDWADHGGFKYSRKKSNDLLDDLHIHTFKEYLGKEEIEISDLTNRSVYRFSQSNEDLKDHWKVYECVYFEYSDGNRTSFLTGGKWYDVKNSLVEIVNTYYQSISTDNYGINFIEYNHKDENEYNKKLAEKNSALRVDRDKIQIEGKSTFEFCDVYTKNRELIHIKRYSRSSVLSHLFNQGYVSASFLLDEEFREKINKELEGGFKMEDTSERPNISDDKRYSVIFGIVSKFNRALELPFFSKLTLMHVAKSLINLGFNISLVKIKNIKPEKISKEE